MSNQTIHRFDLFQVGASCISLDVPLRCGIGIDRDGSISSLGPWRRGTFEPRVDIAGPGFLWATGLTSIFILIGGIIAMGRDVRKWRKVRGRLELHYPPAKERQGMPKSFHKAFRTYLLATSDTQMLLMFAYGLNFFLVQKCTISAYHYTIVIDLGLISCGNFVLTTAFVSEYWKAPVTGGLRFSVMAVVFAFLGLALNHQRTRIENPEYSPPYSRKDSTLLLPASCFLDSQFKDIYSGLDPSVREKIGYPLRPYQIWEFSLWIVSVIGLAAGFGRTVMQLLTDREGKAKTYSFWKGFVICLYKSVALTLVGIMSGIAWLRIYFLRTWVDRSGWIKPGRTPNPENDWLENGQTLPMLQLLMIAIFILNEFELSVYSSTLKRPSRRSSFHLDDLNRQ